MAKQNLGIIREVIITLDVGSKMYNRRLVSDLDKILVEFGARKSSDNTSLGIHSMEYGADLVSSFGKLETAILNALPQLEIDFSSGEDEDSLEYSEYQYETMTLST